MKKLMVLLVLVLTFSCIFTTPVFAGQPPDEAHQGLERTIEGPGTSDPSWQSMIQGFIAPIYYGSVPVLWFGPTVAYYKILSLI
jgi:hypothetical protein